MHFESLNYLIPFLFAAIVLAYLPGPSLLYVMARTVSGGREAGIASTAGTAAGGMVHVLIAAVGLSALLTSSVAVFSAVKFIGAFYLIYLGLRTIFGEKDTLEYSPKPKSKGNIFYEGALIEVLNIKTGLFFLAFIPQFVDPSTAAAPQFLALGMVCILFNSIADLTVVFFAARLSTYFEGHSNSPNRLAYGSGGILVALGIYTALVDVRQ